MASKEPETANEIMQPHVVLFASPGMGHLIPMSELARLLASPRHGFAVTMITKPPTISSSENNKVLSCLASLPSSVTVAFLPSPDDHDGPNNSFNANDELLYISRSLPDLHETVKSLKSSSNVVALIADFLSVDAITVARRLGLPFFVFSPINLMAFSFLMNGSRLDHEAATDLWDVPSIQLPGWRVPIRGTDLGVAYKDRQSAAYKRSMHWSEQVLLANGILCNTFCDIDPELSTLMRERDPNRPPVYTVGPLIQSIQNQQESVFDCVEWLDNKLDGSVLFVSFGSECTSLSPAQIAELAFGLELSKQNFLWAFKISVGSSGAEFLLPEGFIERTKEIGLVVHSWAPQREILNHGSIGGFLTHCGWNSVLESVMSGVPMVAWPLRAEQGVNARFIVDGIKVALRLHVRDDASVVHRDAIAEAVKELMRGEGGRVARKNAREMKKAGGEALLEGGSSFEDVARWKISLGL